VILQRYVLRESLLSSILSLLVFLGVIQALFLADLLGDAARGELPTASVVILMLLRLPEAVLMVGPLALMVGLLLTLGRLGENNELAIVRSGGAGYLRFLAPVLGLVLAWSAALLSVSGWLAPMAVERTTQLMADAARHALVAGLQPGQFDSMDQGRLTLYVGSVDKDTGELTDVFVQYDAPGAPEILTAARGRLWTRAEDESRFLSLFDGHQLRHPGKLGDASLREMSFARNDILLPMPRIDAGIEGELNRTLPELWPPATPVERREWHWRWAAPIAAVLLGMLAVPLSRRGPRGGRFGALVLALGLYLFYSNGIHAGLILMEQRASMSGPALWPLHGALAGLTGWLLWRYWRRW